MPPDYDVEAIRLSNSPEVPVEEGRDRELEPHPEPRSSAVRARRARDTDQSDHEDLGLYITQGSVEVAGDVFDAGRMMVFRPGDRISVRAGAQGARLITLGCATMNEGRLIWWNFVSSSHDRIEAAKEAWKKVDWESGPLRSPLGDDAEHIPISPDLERTIP